MNKLMVIATFVLSSTNAMATTSGSDQLLAAFEGVCLNTSSLTFNEIKKGVNSLPKIVKIPYNRMAFGVPNSNASNTISFAYRDKSTTYIVGYFSNISCTVAQRLIHVPTLKQELVSHYKLHKVEDDFEGLEVSELYKFDKKSRFTGYVMLTYEKLEDNSVISIGYLRNNPK